MSVVPYRWFIGLDLNLHMHKDIFCALHTGDSKFAKSDLYKKKYPYVDWY